ncbi:hypothetical protein KZ870_35755 [Pseudomonas aeruginosa]|nr:hypothetical protein [Pseudomonas aeruginosa]
MSEPTAHGSHGGCAHHHHHLPFGGGLLSRDKQRRAARQQDAQTEDHLVADGQQPEAQH